jgi:ATP-dependent DNA ligase
LAQVLRERRLGRGNNWVKKTCAQRETRVIAGFALDGGKWDGIYVGRRKGKDLNYAGKVDQGFDKASAADLRKRLTPLIKTQPYTRRIAHKGIWVEPELLVEIEYRAKSSEGNVRHPFFKGLREDLKHFIATDTSPRAWNASHAAKKSERRLLLLLLRALAPRCQLADQSPPAQPLQS